MVRRLVEADFHARRARPGGNQIRFWLREARSAAFLLELCRRYPASARAIAKIRPAVQLSLEGNVDRIEQALRTEEEHYRAADRLYWQPLRAELAQWRRARGK